MAKFAYKYENIKRIKKIFEKEVQRQISQLNIKIQKLNEYKEELIREKEDEKSFFSNHNYSPQRKCGSICSRTYPHLDFSNISPG